MMNTTARCIISILRKCLSVSTAHTDEERREGSAIYAHSSSKMHTHNIHTRTLAIAYEDIHLEDDLSTLHNKSLPEML
jgi:hypothetical protein